MRPVMTGKSLVFRLSSFAAILAIPPVALAQSTNKTVDDSYIHNSYQPNGTNSYLDGIQYHPAWIHTDGDPNRLKSTYSYTTKPLTNLGYFFQGDAIYYYGETGGSDHIPVTIYLDAGKAEVVPTNTSPSSVQYRELLWSKTGLGPGDHQITISTGNQSGQVGLDYLIIESDHGFTPSHAGPAASSISPGAIIVDDTNLDYITYTDWLTDVFESGTMKFYYNNTIHRTKVPGSYATFKFTGTAVWYITDTLSTHADLNFTLDGVFNDVLSQRVIWNATNLEYGEHTVIVTHKDDSSSYATLDYFMYLPGKAPQESGLPTGAIAGGVVGGVALIAIGVAGCMFIRRRRATKLRSDIDLDGFNGAPLLVHDNGAQPVAVPPAWGYVTTPYAPGPNGNSGTSPNHNIEPRPRKGYPVESPAPNIVASSGAVTFSTEESATRATYTDEPGSRDSEADVYPPPYVHV